MQLHSTINTQWCKQLIINCCQRHRRILARLFKITPLTCSSQVLLHHWYLYNSSEDVGCNCHTYECLKPKALCKMTQRNTIFTHILRWGIAGWGENSVIHFRESEKLLPTTKGWYSEMVYGTATQENPPLSPSLKNILALEQNLFLLKRARARLWF